MTWPQDGIILMQVSRYQCMGIPTSQDVPDPEPNIGALPMRLRIKALKSR